MSVDGGTVVSPQVLNSKWLADRAIGLSTGSIYVYMIYVHMYTPRGEPVCAELQEHLSFG